MREWHPDFFPDSVVVQNPLLNKDFLEYKLDTLTSRKEEQTFEEFCRKLAEKEICPNIKPQTGPTGGGDSKTDAATYPMAPELARHYYWGNPNSPTDENWAFAFSCKKKWKPKIQEDAAKIAALPRKFTKVYFVTNQFAKDKDRSALEDELTKKHGFEAHILDRNWIVKRVLEHGHWRLAVDALGIQGQYETRTVVGPRDAERESELTMITARIERLTEDGSPPSALALDNLQAALLVRGLGRPRNEVEGYLAVARRHAEVSGSRSIQIRCGYNQAWTAFWWFNDTATLHKTYAEIEPFVLGTPDADEADSLLNLWFLLFAETRHQKATTEELEVDVRRDRLEAEFQRLAAEPHRPGNALVARTSLALLQMTCAEDDAGKGAFIRELSVCLDASRGVLAYPAKQIIRRVQGISTLLRDHPEYDGLFTKMRDRVRELDGDAAEGELLYQRGYEHLDADQPDKALQCLGQAKLKLSQDDTMRAACRAALGCAMAYNYLGLFWAMRMEALSAGHMALKCERGELRYPWEGFWSLGLLARHELMVGRPMGVMAWYELAAFTASYLDKREQTTDGITRELEELDTLFGIRLYREQSLNPAAWDWMIPVLSQLGSNVALTTLRYRCGEGQKILSECSPEFASTGEEPEARFQELSAMAADSETLRPIEKPGSKFVTLTSERFGVEFRISARNSPGPVLLAENLLGIIEAALAVAKWENLAFIQERFELRIDTSSTGKNPAEIDFIHPPRNGEFRLEWGTDLFDWLCRGPRTEVLDWFRYFLFSVLGTLTIDPMDDLEAELAEWHKAGTFNRALAYSPTAILQDNLIRERWHDRNCWIRTAATSEIQRRGDAGADS
jgi:hypothetical protein